MLNTYTVLTNIKVHLASAVPTNLTALGSTNTVNLFDIGFADPYRLENYDAMLLIPQARQPNPEEAVIDLPIDLLIAVQAETIEDARKAQYAIMDAVYEAVEDDPTLGGAVYLSEVQEQDEFDPRPGILVAGAVLRLMTEIDTLGGT